MQRERILTGWIGRLVCQQRWLRNFSRSWDGDLECVVVTNQTFLKRVCIFLTRFHVSQRCNAKRGEQLNGVIVGLSTEMNEKNFFILNWFEKKLNFLKIFFFNIPHFSHPFFDRAMPEQSHTVFWKKWPWRKKFFHTAFFRSDSVCDWRSKTPAGSVFMRKKMLWCSSKGHQIPMSINPDFFLCFKGEVWFLSIRCICQRFFSSACLYIFFLRKGEAYNSVKIYSSVQRQRRSMSVTFN